MKKVVFYSFIFVIFLSSCVNKSYWGKVIIPPDQELVFTSPEDDVFASAFLVLPINNDDTIFVKNRRLVEKVCYLRQVYPKKDITVSYIKLNDDKESFEARFVD